MTVPTPDGVRNPLVLAAMHIAGVSRVFCVGGAQAIAALAFGTQTIPRVDKIVGPGGAFVAAAKRLVFGPVGIDVIAGPSEILVISDGSATADWLALDLFSQAEHDAAAQAILLTPNAEHLEAVHASMQRLLPSLPRRDTIARSLQQRGALILTRDLDEAVAIANRIAPEHLELAVADPDALLPSDPARRRDFRRRIDERSARRLRRRPEPRVADVRHGAIRIAARRVRLSEALVGDSMFGGRRGSARRDCVDAGDRRRAHRARALGAGAHPRNRSQRLICRAL